MNPPRVAKKPLRVIRKAKTRADAAAKRRAAPNVARHALKAAPADR